ncbi:sulfite exporter TauE/SafE family protein [Sinomonas sp. G460-2]|uniref:sulfite exporter TauE/SafE family protein n=1 Tax=Sinomonas sp. G460-2 TaxID=3393464 RepID=UPI0039EEF46F
MSPDHLWSLAALAGATFLGASTQRISGVGFALVASPFLVMILGPFNGVIVVNVFGTLTALLVFVQVFRQVEYRRVFAMMIPAIIAVVPGSWVASHAPPALLSTLIGAMIILALVASLTVRQAPALQSRFGAAAAGFVSGFMNVTAGVGGPAVTAYALASRWKHAAFAVSIQLYFFGVGLASLAAKHSVPALDLPQWAACAAALVLGIVLGNYVGPKIPAKASRAAVVVLAFTGAALLLVNGILALA